jgi:hypothetical protein
MYFYCVMVYIGVLNLVVATCSVCLFLFCLGTLLNARIMNSELKGCGISHCLYVGLSLHVDVEAEDKRGRPAGIVY